MRTPHFRSGPDGKCEIVGNEAQTKNRLQPCCRPTFFPHSDAMVPGHHKKNGNSADWQGKQPEKQKKHASPTQSDPNNQCGRVSSVLR